MADAQGQAPNTAPPGQEPTTNPQPQPGGQDPQAGGLDALPDWARTEIRSLRAESAGRRKKLEELEGRVKSFEERDQTEAEKLQKAAAEAQQKAEAAEARARGIALRAAIEREARKLNVVDEDAAARLLDLDAVEYDGDSPRNIPALLQDLVKARPYLVAQAAATGGSPSNPPRDTARQLTRDDIARMTPEQINEAYAKGLLNQALGART